MMNTQLSIDQIVQEIEPVVYVVDDEETSREAIGRMVKQRGIAFQAHSTAIEFLDGFDPNTYGCVVLDFRMPGLDGIELQRRMNERKFKIPIIFVSEKPEVATATSAMRAGALDLMEKPIKSEELWPRLTQAFEQEYRRFKQNRKAIALERGIKTLTSKEREVLPYIYKGLSLKQIAGKFNVTVATASRHQSRVFEKLGVESSVELIHLVKAANLDINHLKTLANSN
jgi:two-component system, LuxR family, response regulator FixJ